MCRRDVKEVGKMEAEGVMEMEVEVEHGSHLVPKGSARGLLSVCQCCLRPQRPCF